MRQRAKQRRLRAFAVRRLNAMTYPKRPRGSEGEGEMTGLRPAGRPWTLADDDQLRTLLVSGMKQRLIAQKMKRSIGAIQSRIFLFKKPYD